MRILFFVHGTGVRGKSYDTTVKLIQSKAREFLPSFGFASCAWYPYGAQLNKLGDSIPDYGHTGDVLKGLNESSAARWRVLAEDPLLELRILPRDKSPGGPRGPEIWKRLQALPQAPKVLNELKVWYVGEAWTTFLSGDPPEVQDDRWEGILYSPEWKATVGALTPPPTAVSDRVARAVIAAFQIYLRQRNLPGLDGRQRETLRAVLIDPLGGPARAIIKDWVLERFEKAGTNYARRRRGMVTDATSPMVGDILRYQARGGEIRNYIRGEIERAAKGEHEMVILAHSLGGVACVDMLAEAELPCVKHLITAGSQAPYFYEINALVSREFGAGLGEHFKQKWANFYDLRDFLSYRAAKIFPGIAVDFPVDNGQVFPESHSAYWNNEKQFWKIIAKQLQSA
jgi:hypothetical protein